MRSRLEWLERLAANAEVATVLGSIPASSDTVESEGWLIKLCGIQYIEENPKNPPVKKNLCMACVPVPDSCRGVPFHLLIHEMDGPAAAHCPSGKSHRFPLL